MQTVQTQMEVMNVPAMMAFSVMANIVQVSSRYYSVHLDHNNIITPSYLSSFILSISTHKSERPSPCMHDAVVNA